MATSESRFGIHQREVITLNWTGPAASFRAGHHPCEDLDVQHVNSKISFSFYRRYAICTRLIYRSANIVPASSRFEDTTVGFLRLAEGRFI